MPVFARVTQPTCLELVLVGQVGMLLNSDGLSVGGVSLALQAVRDQLVASHTAVVLRDELLIALALEGNRWMGLPIVDALAASLPVVLCPKALTLTYFTCVSRGALLTGPRAR